MKKKAIEDLYPLTPMQQGMLFHSLYDPHSGVYFEQVNCTLHGDLNVVAFEQAWQRVVERHPILRTGFQWQQRDEPFQVVYRRAKLPLEQHDWRDAPPDEQAERLAAYEQSDRSRGFDLSQTPLMRLALIRLAEQTYQLIWSYHHILLDGWSSPLLLKEVFAFYHAFCQGQELALAHPRPYGDYIGWLQQQDSAKAEAFWRQMLKGLTAPTQLRIDTQSEPGADGQPAQEYGQQELMIPAEVTAALQGFARQHQLTVNTLVQGAWALLLSRYSDEPEVVFGATVSGRPPDLPGIEAMIGLFINTLPVRVRLAPGDTLAPWLQELQAQQLELRQYEYSPLVQMHGWSDVPRGVPLFESLVVFENYPLGASLRDQSGGLRIEDVRVVERTNYPLTLAGALTGTTLALKLSYASNRFAATAIQRLLGHLQTLLAQMAARPAALLCDLPMLSEAEQQQILRAWNATQAPYPDDQCLHQLIEAQVARTPDAVAVSLGNSQLTYQEMNQRANQVAHYLRGMQVGPEVQVGVCMERSLELVVALLGVLKAGGAYVPLDPRYPAERLAFLIDDAQATILLTNKEIRDWRLEIDAPEKSPISNLQSPTLVYLDTDWEQIARQPATNPAVEMAPDNLAYVIHTSGSTGQPKGAMVAHRGICNLLTHRQRMYPLTSRDRLLQTCSFSFDPSVWGMFWPLVTGAHLVMIRPDGQRDSGYLAETLATQQATVYDSTGPAILQVLIEEPGFAACRALRHVFSGGDVLRGELQERFFGLLTAALHGPYGPTEATVDATAWTCRHDDPHGPPRIGQPIANAQIYLLDRDLNPVPVGIPGELYIGGVGLARGYLNRPELTAERFIPNPFAQERLEIGDWRLRATQSPISNLQSPISDRLYKTGDLARWQADGTIEFLGRRDHQVKLRGFRIELGEIEAALQSHPSVASAAVIAREDTPGDKRLVAYIVPGDWRLEIGDSDADNLQSPISNLPQDLRQFLRERLPAHMLPASIVVLEQIPLLANGKVNRNALPAPETTERYATQAFVAPQTPVETVVAEIWAKVLRLEQVGCDDNFFDLGGHSLLIIQVQSQIRNRLQCELPIVDLFRFPTIRTLAAFIGERQRAQAEPQRETAAAKPLTPPRPTRREDTAIAIIGMAGRFPGAATLEAFWRNLRDGVESITTFSDQELLESGVDPAVLRNPTYVKAAAPIDGIELFDAAFFGYSPREAALIDPQQRLFLECAWEALERAGYAHGHASPIGVFAGASLNSYMFALATDPDLNKSVGSAQLVLGNVGDHLATRVSYKLNLSGPSLTVQTACSTSLVAVHLACQSLLDDDCDLALAGGVSLQVPQKRGRFYVEGGIMSPDGHCRAFDARAQGTVNGSGLGVVAMKRLADALADGDTIHAVIKGSAINNDGAQKVGYTAPSVDGQSAVIAKALARAGFEPETISYVEAHGTGTPLGDPIEIAALTQAFRARTDQTGFCAIGSLKTNIGHLDTAAGVAGLLKTVLALEHRALPPTLHFERPNPQIDFVNSPFYVNSSFSAWPNGSTPRRAGVSSFGIGGTNAHVVLEEAPTREPSGPSRPWQLLVISARTDSALEAATGNLAAYLADSSPREGDKRSAEGGLERGRGGEGAAAGSDLADIAYTLQAGRRAFGSRRMLVCSSAQDAVSALESRDPRRVLSLAQHSQTQSVAFMFSGQGAQYVDMARELYQAEPVFREHLDRCAELLRPHLNVDLREAIYPNTKRMEDGGWRMEDGEPAILHPPSSILNQTQYTQPALFAVEYALAQLWMAWGVRPQALIGHSIGEYVAACLAGVFSLEDALMLVAARGRLMQELPAGVMLAVSLPEAQLRPLLHDHLSLAAINGPAHCVVAGPAEAVTELEQRLAAQGVECRRLHTSHAFHSRMMDAVLEPFAGKVRTIQLHAPRLPYLSNLTGTWITAEQATSPDYWAAHLRQTVRFADGLGELLKEPNRVLLEVGPGSTLITLARRHPNWAAGQTALATLRRPQDQQSDQAFLLGSLGQLWLAGVPIDWAGFYAAERRQRVALPTYPFERQRYWIDARKGALPPPTAPAQVGKQTDIGEWFYRPVWKPGLAPSCPDLGALLQAKAPWLVFADTGELGMPLIDQLLAAGCPVVRVQSGTGFTQHSSTHYSIRPDHKQDYQRLFAALEIAPRTLVHLWSCAPPRNPDAGRGEAPLSVETLTRAQQRGFYSLLSLVKAIGSRPDLPNLELWVVSQNVHQITGGEALAPEYMPLVGACTVVNQEHPTIHCRHIDIDRPTAGSWQEQKLVQHLLAECAAPSAELTRAYRHTERWSQTYEQLPATAGDTSRLRPQGVYLITGGLGNIGLVLAEHLARTVQARLILTTRSAFPPASEWTAWLDSHPATDATSRKIRRLQAVRASGAEVLVLQADVADETAMRNVRDQIQERFGRLHGIIYAAGALDEAAFAPIETIERDQCELYFKPKAHGLLTLDRVFGDQQLDFCLLFSSLASVLGGLGFSAYAAANSFIDAFVHQHNQQSPARWTSINWDAWGIGEQEHSKLGTTVLNFAMEQAEALQAFERVLAIAPLAAQLVNSTGSLEARLAQWVRMEPLRTQAKGPAIQHGRPNLATAYAVPGSDAEQRIAEIWQELLGVAPIGIYDNFFELGGHSLLGTQLISRLHATFEIQVPLRMLFEAPTVADLALVVESLLIEGLEAAPRIPRRPEHEPVPLSFAQERLWFLDQLAPGNAGFIMPIAVRLTGQLHARALRRALNTIVARHETLRTSFVAVDGRPIQIIDPAGALREAPLPVIDLGGQPAERREALVRQLAAAELGQPFDLAQGPLLRTRLLRLDESTHVLLLTMHHIVTDGWSVSILLQELAALYEAYRAGRPSPLSALPIQYSDFAVWQRNWLQGPILDSQLAYWREQLAAAPAALDLPFDRPRPAEQTLAGASFSFTLPPPLTQAIRALNLREGTTLFMTLLAALNVLLARYTGQAHIVVGTPIANRHHRETEGLIGFFINSLVIHTDLSGHPSFRELLGRVREITLGAYAHQDMPFAKLVEALQPKRDPSRHPLYQVMCTLQNTPPPQLELPGLTLTPFVPESGTAQLDLSLTMVEAADTINGTLEYHTDLFEPATIARMADHFQILLEHATAHPETRLSELPLWTPAERQQLLVAWNATQAEYPTTSCVHELIAMQASRTPDAVALVFDDQQLTYQELLRRAGHLACRLRQLGVGPDVLVGLCLERSPEMVVGLLGILMAGGAYVPLDPTYPAERLAFMLADAQVALLLTNKEIRDWRLEIVAAPQSPISNLQSLPVIAIDADWEQIARQPATNLDSGVTPDNLAYVIYTSGSTGTPKGVQIPHRAVVNFLTSMRREPGMASQDVLLSVTTLSFDIAALELFLPLTVGARLVLVPREVAADGTQLGAQLAAYGATVMQATPATWRLLLESGWAAGQQMRVLCGGEALPRELARQLAGQGAELWNMYGPTETTIWSTTAALAPEATAITIGRPIANTQIYLLDAHMQPVPLGVPGELYIGGAGLARGYLNRPELTAERFVPNPFTERGRGGEGERGRDPLSSSPPLPLSPSPLLPVGGRLYRTGDLARYRADGTIEYLGRIDTQVKLRGFRIELGEIEAVLAQHPGVRDVAVIAREDVIGDKRLIAYIVAGDWRLEIRDSASDNLQSPISNLQTELRDYLKTRLPDYMIPATFVTLEALPLTPNGKLDRRALPTPDTARPALGHPFVAPRIPTEEQLAAIWRDLLQVDQVGIYDSFFDLGGHSLLLTQLAARIRQLFEVELPVRMLFDAHTIADMAEAITARKIEQVDPAELDLLLEELQQLSPDEINALLREGVDLGGQPAPA